MKQIIINRDNLKEKDITETVIRIKALLINGENILIGNADNVMQFPGGHLEEGETFEHCLKREIEEETGIEIKDSQISKPFMKHVQLSKDWPEVGKNRKAEIYYYVVKTDQKPDLSKTNYTENEKEHNFKIEFLPLKDSIEIIKNNIPKNEINKAIGTEMITVLKEYLNTR